MSSKSVAATELARHALDALDAGDVDAVRVVLRSVLSETDPQSAELSPAARQRFGRALLACTIGRPYWRQSRLTAGPDRGPTSSQPSDVSSTTDEESPESAVATARRWLATSPPAERSHIADAILFLKTITAPARTVGGLSNLLAECNYPSWDGTETQAIELLLRSRTVDRRLAERSTWRLVFIAHSAGMTQRQIARLLHEPQATVHRRLRQLDESPERVAVSPSEIVDRYFAEQIDRAAMLSLLASYPYDRGEYPSGAEDWAYVPGSWDELTRLTVEGELTTHEFDFIVNAVENRAQHALPTPA